MRRLMLAVAVSATLALAMAAPAVAAPEQNPWAFPLTVTCDNDTFEVITTGKVGFPVDGSEGTSGISFGGTHTIFIDGQVVSQETYAPPPGLVGKLEVCRSERPFEPNGLSVWDPLYILRPAQ
jgi:opacity protein-like surface antigen